MNNYNSQSGSPSTLETEPLSALRLKHLDLAMEQSRLLASGAAVPPEFTSALEENSQVIGCPPALLYEDLVITNPLDTPDARTFLDGDDRAQEILFYTIHREIEETLGKGVRLIEDFFDISHREQKKYALVDAIDAGITSLRKVIDRMQILERELSPDVFSRMRPFFTNPAPYPGPSGKFSAGMFCLDGLLVGNDSNIRPMMESKMKSLAFFPRVSLKNSDICGITDMQRIFHNHSKLHVEIIPGGAFSQHVSYHVMKYDLKRSSHIFSDESFRVSFVQELLSLLQQLRGIHARIIMRFIPEASQAGETGTAGEDIQKHIHSIRDAYRKACSL